MAYPQLKLRRNSERLLTRGHPWVYSGAVAAAPAAAPGAIVDVCDFRSRFVARGYYNPHSTIAVRVLTRDRECAIDRGFLARAIRRSVLVRRGNPELAAATDAVRLVHGENDGLPGLVVDDYAGYLVVQLHTWGMELLRSEILDVLEEVVDPRGIHERSDVGTRRADGLKDRRSGHLRGEEPPRLIEIREGEVRLCVDVRRGQKTGFFLDQRDNRMLLGRYAAGRSVIDCFGYTGGFAAHAARGGARSVVSVDIARDAAALAARNVGANSGDSRRRSQVVADLFPMLEQLSERGPRFDVVVLDPPALVRRSRDVKTASGVYIKLNRNAMKLVADGGFLMTSSCSTRISQEEFFQIARRAAAGARVQARILACNQHPPDHPVDPAFPEGRYLKTILLQVFR